MRYFYYYIPGYVFSTLMMRNTLKDPIKIIIADYHPLCLEGFKKIFNDIPEFAVVGAVENGEQLIKIASQLDPDIIITEIRMPGIDGIQATSHLVKKFPDINIIGISMTNEQDIITDMMNAGAKG